MTLTEARFVPLTINKMRVNLNDKELVELVKEKFGSSVTEVVLDIYESFEAWSSRWNCGPNQKYYAYTLPKTQRIHVKNAGLVVMLEYVPEEEASKQPNLVERKK